MRRLFHVVLKKQNKTKQKAKGKKVYYFWEKITAIFSIIIMIIIINRRDLMGTK